MKKFLAFLLAMTTCFCAFTACGSSNDDDDNSKSGSRKSSSEKEDDDDDTDKDEDDDDDDDKSSKSDNKKSDKDVDEYEIPGEDANDDDDDDDKKDDKKEDKKDDNKEDHKSSGSSVSESDDVYLDLFNSFCNYAMEKDTEKLMNLTFPDKLIDALKKTNSYDFMAETINDSYDAMEKVDLSSVTISKVKDCDAETKENLEKLYSVYSNLFIAMAENDIMYDQMDSGNIDESKLLLILDPAMQIAQLDDIENLDVDISMPFEEAKTVTFTADGDEQEFIMYRLKGEDWKIDTIGFAFFEF